MIAIKVRRVGMGVLGVGILVMVERGVDVVAGEISW
jgi:hypothetical protein